MLQDENNMLKTQNDELSSKLRRTEVILSRVKEELARFRASTGKNPYIDFDEEHRLNIKLKVCKHNLSIKTNTTEFVGIMPNQ